MNRTLSILCVLCFALTQPALPAPGSRGESDERYLLLATSRAGTLEAELNGAGADGYRVLAAWAGGVRGEFVAMLEKDEAGVPREFKVLEEVLQGALDEAAAQGFRVVPGGLLRNRGTLILERIPGQIDPREYRLFESVAAHEWDDRNDLYRRNLGDLEDELARLPADGYRLVGMMGLDMGRNQVHHILIEEKLPESGSPPDDGLCGTGPYRVLSARPGADLQQQLNQAGADGFRLRFGWMVLLPMPQLTLIMEADSEATGPYQYLMLGTGVCCLSGQLESAGHRGYRPHPQGLFGLPDIVLLERAPANRTAYEFRWAITTGTSNLQSDVIALAAEGFDLVAANDWEEVVYQGENRWTRNSSIHRGVLQRAYEPDVIAAGSGGIAGSGENLTLSIPAGDKKDKIEDGLNEAADGGYCLVNIAAFHDSNSYAGELALTLERRGDSRECEYKVLATKRIASMENDLNKAAADGFRLVRGSWFDKPAFMGTRENAVVMEKTPESIAHPVEYRLLATQRVSTLLEEIEEAKREGYELLARTRVGENIAYMERPVGGQDGGK